MDNQGRTRAQTAYSEKVFVGCILCFILFVIIITLVY